MQNPSDPVELHERLEREDRARRAQELMVRLKEAGAFALVGNWRPLVARELGELKLAEVCALCVEGFRQDFENRKTRELLLNRARARRVAARKLERSDPLDALRLQREAEALSPDAERGASLPSTITDGSARTRLHRDARRINGLVTDLFLVLDHATEMRRWEILERAVPAILGALPQAIPPKDRRDDILPRRGWSVEDVESRFKKFLRDERKKHRGKTARDLLSARRGLLFAEDARFPCESPGPRRSSLTMPPLPRGQTAR